MKLHGIQVEDKLKPNTEKGKRVWSNTGFGGYPGLTHTAKQICEYIPHCKLFIEPFAGLGRISKHVKADKKLLNDLSDFAVTYLRNHFKDNITQLDFYYCIWAFDSKDTFFFIDPPWIDEMYDNNPNTELSKPCKQIYKELEELLPTIKGNWIIAGMDNGPLKKWGYNHKLVTSKKNYLFGKKAKTYLVSNLPFVNHHQTSLL